MSFFSSITAFFSSPKKEDCCQKPCEPVWGKQGEWAKYDQHDDRRVFYIDIGDCPPQKAEEFLNKMRENLKNAKCCDNEVDLKVCETNCCKTEVGVSKPTSENLFWVKGDKPLRAMMLVYIDVGSLPPYHVEAFLARRLGQWSGLFERLPDDVGVMLIPQRPPCKTRVEIMPLGKFEV
jgi:hypothetical protein